MFRLVKIKDKKLFNSKKPNESHFCYVGKYSGNTYIVQFTHLKKGIKYENKSIVDNPLTNDKKSILAIKREHLIKPEKVIFDKNGYVLNEGVKDLGYLQMI